MTILDQCLLNLGILFYSFSLFYPLRNAKCASTSSKSPFPTRNRKQAMDEQFARFLEMIEKIHVSVPLMDVLHVPSYAKYIKDIINNKRPLPSMEVVKLTEECSAAILDFPKKKKDPRCPTISFSIMI